MVENSSRKRRFIFFLSLILALPGQTWAGIKIGGDLRTELTYGFNNADYTGAGARTNLLIFNNALSRLHFTYKSDDEKYQSYVELGTYSAGTPEASNRVETRQAWFQYNWGHNYVRFGQASDITADFGPNQTLLAFNGLVGFGVHDFEKNEQIRLKLGEQYVLKLALERPRKTSPWLQGGQYNLFPALSASGELYLGPVVLNPWAHYEYTQGQQVGLDGSDDGFHTLDFGFKINGEFGKFGFGAGVDYGINSALEAGVWGNRDARYSLPTLDARGKTKSDSRYLGVWGEVRWDQLYVGYGRAMISNPDWRNDPYSQSAYVNYVIPFGLMAIIPEVCWLDYGHDENNQAMGQQVLFGVLCRLVF